MSTQHPSPTPSPYANGHPPAAAGGHPGGYMPAPPPMRPVSNGTGAWLQFLWLYIPVPVIANLAWITGAIVSWVTHMRTPGNARENARNALNWAITANLILLLVIVLAFFSMFTATGMSFEGTVSGDHPLIAVYIGLLCLIPVVGIACLVFGIVGAIQASRREVFRVPIAVPFVRAARQP